MCKKKTLNRGLESANAYVDALQDKYSKLCVVRVDLGYKKPHSNNTMLDDANKDFNRMMNNRRSKPSVFKGQVGYICKKEYTKDKGVHFHAFFFYDGQKVQRDKSKGTQIGKYWNEQITANKGSYHNCNLNEYKDNGVGMLKHNDTKKRENLDAAVSYLFKDDKDQDLTPVKSNQNDRSLVRGTMPKSEKKMGRRRLKDNQEDK